MTINPYQDRKILTTKVQMDSEGPTDLEKQNKRKKNHQNERESKAKK